MRLIKDEDRTNHNPWAPLDHVSDASPHGCTWQRQALRVALLGFDSLQAAHAEREQNRQLPVFIGKAIPLIIQKVGEIMGPSLPYPESVSQPEKPPRPAQPWHVG